MIDRDEASAALTDIDEIVRRVRQSQIYDVASRIMMMWGVPVFAGDIVNYLWPRYGGYIWIFVDIAGVLGSFAIIALRRRQAGMQTFNFRMLAAFALLFAFGFLCTGMLGHFTPRQQGTFWPIYFMLFYSIAGLWFGYAFVAIGLGISALTLIGYFHAGAAFLLWMAFVNGGGLILGGLWMRRS